jgi:hypothetical protein
MARRRAADRETGSLTTQAEVPIIHFGDYNVDAAIAGVRAVCGEADDSRNPGSGRYFYCGDT